MALDTGWCPENSLPPLPRQAMGLHPDAAVQVEPWMVPKGV